MAPPGLVEHEVPGPRRDEPHGRSRWDRIRPGRSLLLFPLAVAGGLALLIGAFATASQLFTEEKGTWREVAGAAAGNFVIAFVVALLVSALLRNAGQASPSTGPRSGADIPPPRRGARRPAPMDHVQLRRPVMRGIVKGGVLGALPGLLLCVVPLLLADVDLISGDQAQIGFVGLPILIIGTLLGTSTAASDTGCAGAVLLGNAAGFVVGLGVGLLIDVGLRAAGVGLFGVWLFLTPLGMIAGSVFACHHVQPTSAR